MNPIAIVGNGLDAMMAFYRMKVEGRPFAMFAENRSTDPINYFGEWIAPTLPYWTGRVYPIIPQFWGESETYATKRYRQLAPWVHLDWPTAIRQTSGIDPVEFHNMCYAEIGDLVNREDGLTAEWLEKKLEEFPKIIVASDRSHFCKQPMFHVFRNIEVSVFWEYYPLKPGEVVYNGNYTNAWFRASNISGHGTLVEFGEGMEPPGSKKDLLLAKVPVSTNCDCWKDDERIQFVGKVGKYDDTISLADGFKCNL